MIEKTLNEVLADLRISLKKNDLAGALKLFELLRPADQADLMEELETSDQVALLSRLRPTDSADVLEEMEDEDAATLAELLSPEQLADILDEMEIDEAADVLGDLPQERVTEVLREMKEPDDVIPLLRYPDETAGGLMTPAVITLHQDWTAEQALAEYFGYESCLILGSGFVANLTLIATLFGKKDSLALDKRLHASTVAGVRHSHAAFHTFRHNSMSHLEKILGAHATTAVLTESLFSMDGDSPDFAALKQLKDAFNFLCIVDEAHAFGVLGENGRGLGRQVADIAVGTLGKAFGLFGAFILCPGIVREHLLHFGQGLIYTTALPPWHGDMILEMLQRVRDADDRRDHLRLLGDAARALLGEVMPVRGDAHILALEVGDEAKSLALAEALRREGVLVFPARYPTVPLGQAILRVNLTSEHAQTDVEILRDALVRVLEQTS